MVLKSKKMNAPPEESDGIRICIMRNANVYNRQLKNFKEKYGIPMYHMKIKELGPPKDLKDSYRNKQTTWEEYVPIYDSKILKKESNLIKEISREAKRRNITVLCTEPNVKKEGELLKCHRRLFLEECKRYEPDLEIIVE